MHQAANAGGEQTAPVIHPSADVRSTRIGSGTKVGQFCVIHADAVIGRDCVLSAHVVVEHAVQVGDNVTVASGVHLSHGVELSNDVLIGSNVAFTSIRYPRSSQPTDDGARTLVKRGASIGANATILPGITIGEQAMIGAGAVVTRSVPDYATVVGNPATIIGYTHTSARAPRSERSTQEAPAPDTLSIVPGVQLLPLKVAADMRGKLTVAQQGEGLPFVPQRVFMVHDVPSREARGEHAHRACHQLLICVHGQCVAIADDGTNRQEFLLDSNNKALYMPPLIWGTQYRYGPDTVLLVLASHAYDPDDYIRDYREFLNIVGGAAQ